MMNERHNKVYKKHKSPFFVLLIHLDNVQRTSRDRWLLVSVSSSVRWLIAFATRTGLSPATAARRKARLEADERYRSEIVSYTNNSTINTETLQ